MSSKSLANAEAALSQLTAFLDSPAVSERDRAGVIQAFEFTFETVWKLLKRLAEADGSTGASPKQAVIAAYKMGVVRDEILWLDMLRDRSLTSHVYQADLAEKIFSSVRDRYSAALGETVKLARAALGP
jgi:nucleotidyltransferase substrate binding protein (TIGR01987 family)